MTRETWHNKNNKFCIDVILYLKESTIYVICDGNYVNFIFVVWNTLCHVKVDNFFDMLDEHVLVLWAMGRYE